jgi:hypothetical protein
VFFNRFGSAGWFPRFAGAAAPVHVRHRPFRAWKRDIRCVRKANQEQRERECHNQYASHVPHLWSEKAVWIALAYYGRCEALACRLPREQNLVGYDRPVRLRIIQARRIVGRARRSRPLLDQAWDNLRQVVRFGSRCARRSSNAHQHPEAASRLCRQICQSHRPLIGLCRLRGRGY